MKRYGDIWKLFILDLFIIEFGPVGIFFIVYYITNFTNAVLALGISTIIALLASQLINKRVPWFAVFAGSATILTAGLTYWFNLPWILIFKDTVYYLFFASILALSLFLHKDIFKVFFGHVFSLTATGWRVLERRWLYFFIFAGLTNELVRHLLTVDQWVLYKQGIVILFILFGLYQLRVCSHYRAPNADKLGLRKPTSYGSE